MLTAASLGMFAYGAYSILWAVVDLLRGPHVELWAEVGLMFFGLLLALSAAFVRVRLPGGLAFAIGALLGLQALGVDVDTAVAPQVARAAVALTLVGLAWAGGRARSAGSA